ncbi:cache domain-containing protein [uncultured Piscinibacter sp.]|uniref:cache domain-containing protein n=1 Tax=uncultured Piscinibacter sp. TaxID=1131835 RepID=UPI00260FEDB6|nr:cache domain-containing protein [uncultured Piscinibacter sp.]
MHRALAGDASARDALAQVRGKFDRVMRAMAVEISATQRFDATDLWQARRDELAALAEGRHGTQHHAAFAQHPPAIEQLMLRAAEHAGLLSSAVASIRLHQGSADEARDLVDRDLYVFVVDRQGRYLLHAARPEKEGSHVHDVPGIDGNRCVVDGWERTRRGPGWIEYDILHAETGAVQPEASYMHRFDEQRVVGCGVYRTTTAAAAPPQSRLAGMKAPVAPPATTLATGRLMPTR